MDGKRFDRLSVVVHRLRDQASRRGALRLLLGGTAIVATGLLPDEADAKKRKKHKKRNRNKNCRGYGGGCRSNKDCCNGRCRSGICWYTGGGGGGGGRWCGGRRCPNGWSCRNQAGVHVCVPNDFPTYCGGNSWFGPNYICCDGIPNGACLTGGECCGGFGMCCQPGWRCCGGRTCIPRDWDCNDFFQSAAYGDVGTESARIPTMDPAPVADSDVITIDPNAEMSGQ